MGVDIDGLNSNKLEPLDEKLVTEMIKSQEDIMDLGYYGLKDK
jgi:hypothetical protein